MLTAAIIVVVLIVVFVFGVPFVAGRAEHNSATGASGASGAFGVMQEIFHPAAHEANIVKMEIQRKKDVAESGDGDDRDPDAGPKH
ncbi:hypothetical protein [Aeromicrobium sp. 9AM]|uniref:hypothetical protein n=1 Tax=Aeromicrobium sp. 9AM TaxID=2653126 RepID=UPI0012EF09CC|nr:hypothetical protein [Aeromicrobium sp. 9AM]VXB95579.1 conserved exported hypothetical protein [Aeromicrobium sp. 9AM]